MPTQTMEVDVTIWRAPGVMFDRVECEETSRAEGVTCHVHFEIEPLPEPAGAMLGALALCGLAGRRRRRDC